MIYEITSHYRDGKVLFTNNSIKVLDRNGMLLTEDRFSEKGEKLLKLWFTNDTINMRKVGLVFERWTRGYEKMLFKYTYDSSNCLINITERDTLGRVVKGYVYECDKFGYPVKIFELDSLGNRRIKQTATYLHSQNIVAVSHMNRENVIFKDTIKIKDNLGCKNILVQEKYNLHCDLVKYSKFDWDGNQMTYEKEYLYDPKGNRIEEKSFMTSTDSTGKINKTLFESIIKKYVY